MLAILVPWNKSMGYSHNDNLDFLQKNYMVMATYPPQDEEDEIITFDDFIKFYKHITNKSNKRDYEDANYAHISFIKYTYEYNLRTLAYINRHFHYNLQKLSNKIRNNITIDDSKFIKKFRESRGRFPTPEEYESKTL